MIKQNIYLFYEQDENYDGNKIDAKLVKLYMNRFVIEEDYQNEIIGVSNLSKIEKTSYHTHKHPEFTSYETASFELIRKIEIDNWTRWIKFRKKKLMQDLVIMTAAMKTLKRFDTQGGDFHLIVSSWYYMSIYTHHWFPESDGKRPMVIFDHDYFIGKDKKPIEDVIANLISQFSTFNFESSLACTFLCGINFALCKKSQVQRAFRPLFRSLNNFNVNSKNEEINKSILSVNDDLETFFIRLMTPDIFTKLSRKFHGNEHKELFLFQFKDNFEEISYLHKLNYNDSFSVGSNPSILYEARDFPIHSVLFNCEENDSAGKPFFPPIRQPIRQVL